MRPFAWLVLCLLFGNSLQAQKKFLSIYGISDSDFGTSVVATADGGYALISQTQYLGDNLPQIIRTDCNGNIVWTQAFRFSNLCVAYDLVSSGTNLAFLASYNKPVTGQTVTALTLVDFYGNLLWAKELPLRITGNNGHLIAEQGGFVVCGNPSANDADMLLVRMDANGVVTHAVDLRLPSPAIPAGICRLNTGQYAMAGTYPSMVLPTFKDIFVMLAGNDFAPVKTVVYATAYDDEPNGLLADDENNVYICGRSYFTTHNWDAFLLGFNTALFPVLVKCYDGGTPEGEIFRNMCKPLEGNGFVMCGDLGTSDERSPIMVKTENTGHIVFSKQYNFSPAFTNYLFSIVPSPDNGFAATGDVRPPFSFRDTPLLKTDGQGNDSCFAQNITLNAYTPDYSVSPLVFTFENQLLESVDTVPGLVNVPIHQTDVCNAQDPCPAFIYTSYSQCPDLCYNFTDQSVDATAWHWEFEGATPAFSNEENPTGICYAHSGNYRVKLVAANAAGSSVLQKEIVVTVGCEPVFPNIITPNGDGTNDVFSIGQLPQSYSLKIFDRWGLLIQAFTEKDAAWKGTYASGKKVAQGVYYYVFVNHDSNQTHTGFVQVVY